jgi:hypothetical protein
MMNIQETYWCAARENGSFGWLSKVFGLLKRENKD